MNGVEAADEAAPGAREEILNGKIKAADREICAIAKSSQRERTEKVGIHEIVDRLIHETNMHLTKGGQQ